MQTATLKITGMNSEAATASVIRALTSIGGVQSVKVSYAGGNAVVEFDERQTAKQELMSVLAKAGFSRDVQKDTEIAQKSCCGSCGG